MDAVVFIVIALLAISITLTILFYVLHYSQIKIYFFELTKSYLFYSSRILPSNETKANLTLLHSSCYYLPFKTVLQYIQNRHFRVQRLLLHQPILIPCQNRFPVYETG